MATANKQVVLTLDEDEADALYTLLLCRSGCTQLDAIYDALDNVGVYGGDFIIGMVDENEYTVTVSKQ